MEFYHWKSHFEKNVSHFDHINWKDDAFSTKDHQLIGHSIALFQRGENSEGKNLMSFARKWGNESYCECIELFIREEQRHAKILGAFMEIHLIPRSKGNWVDQVFRKLRTWGNLEHSVYILMTAELIAAVYYRALRDASDSNVLKQICRQILIDEEHHLEFQSYTLSLFYSNRNSFSKIWISFHHWLLVQGTILVVWKDHRKVLRKGGFGFFRFLYEVNCQRKKVKRWIASAEHGVPHYEMR